MAKTAKAKEVLSLDQFFSDAMINHVQNKIHFDTKANWLLGVSAIIMGLSLPHVKEIGVNPGYLIIFGSALASFLFSLMIFEPPEFFQNVPHSTRSLMYYKSNKNMTPEEYVAKLKALRTNDEIIEQYAYDIANIAMRGIAIKSRLIQWPTYILFWGTLVGGLLILLL